MSRTFQKLCVLPVDRFEAEESRLGVETKTSSMLACKSYGPFLVGEPGRPVDRQLAGGHFYIHADTTE